MLILDSSINLHNQAPQMLSNLVVPLRVSGSVVGGASNGNCEVPLCKSSFGQVTFSVQTINMWNSLPAEIKLDPDWDHFELKLKQFLKRDQLCSHEWPLFCAL